MRDQETLGEILAMQECLAACARVGQDAVSNAHALYRQTGGWLQACKLDSKSLFCPFRVQSAQAEFCMTAPWTLHAAGAAGGVGRPLGHAWAVGIAIIAQWIPMWEVNCCSARLLICHCPHVLIWAAKAWLLASIALTPAQSTIAIVSTPTTSAAQLT